MVYSILMLILVLLFIAVGVYIIILIQNTNKQIKNNVLESTQPEIVPPTDKNVYVFYLRRQLTDEEWCSLINSGWTLVTCNTEICSDYAGWGPDMPKYTYTKFHYVFKKDYVFKKVNYEQ